MSRTSASLRGAVPSDGEARLRILDLLIAAAPRNRGNAIPARL